jgi:hypothetical protein
MEVCAQLMHGNNTYFLFTTETKTTEAAVATTVESFTDATIGGVVESIVTTPLSIQLDTTTAATVAAEDDIDADLLEPEWPVDVEMSMSMPSMLIQPTDASAAKDEIDADLLEPEWPIEVEMSMSMPSMLSQPTDASIILDFEHIVPAQDCTKELCQYQLSDDLSLQYQVFVPESTTVDECDGCSVRMIMTYEGIAWLGLGFSNDGSMIGSEAVM